MLPKWTTSYFEKIRARRLANYLVKFTQPHQTILDCGCGTMYIANLIRQSSESKIIGTDIINFNETDLEMCISLGEYLPFASKSVDVVMLIFVLHHSTDSIQILEECIRVARHRVIIFEDVYETPFQLKMLKMVDCGNRFISADMPLPFNFKTVSEWKNIFEELGTKLISAETILPFPFLPSNHKGFILDVTS